MVLSVKVFVRLYLLHNIDIFKVRIEWISIIMNTKLAIPDAIYDLYI